MATRIVTRAVQQASRSRLLPLLQRQQHQSSSKLGLGFPVAGASHGSTFFNKMPSPQFTVALLPEEEQHLHRISKLGLGFPPQTDAEASHGSIFAFNMPSPQSALSPHVKEQLQPGISKLGLGFPLLSAQNDPSIQDFVSLAPETLWKFTNSNYFPPSSEMDEVILPGQHEDTSSPMLMSTKRTFQPSTIVRKRRHGFLARKATVGGRRVLARRLAKGRRKLSA